MRKNTCIEQYNCKESLNLDAINREIATQTIIEIGEGAGCSDDKYLGTFEGMGWLR